MQNGIKDYHVTKFSRLVQELAELLDDIQSYCPDAVYRLNTSSQLELGISKDIMDGDDYPYVLAEPLVCDDINDVGTASYCLDEEKEEELRYCKGKKSHKSSATSMKSSKMRRVRRGTIAYFGGVVPYYKGYCNNAANPMSEKEFASWYLNIELID